MPHPLIALLGLCALACGNGSDAGTTSPPGSVTPPPAATAPAVTSPSFPTVERTGGDWTMSSPEAHGLDGEAVTRVVDAIGGLRG